MAIGMIRQFTGIREVQDNAMMERLGLADGQKWPEGIISHVADATDDGRAEGPVVKTQAVHQRCPWEGTRLAGSAVEWVRSE